MIISANFLARMSVPSPTPDAAIAPTGAESRTRRWLDALKVYKKPAALRMLPAADLRAAGLSARKAEYLAAGREIGAAFRELIGSYTIAVTGGQLPCVLRVTSGDTVLHSVANGTGATATANISPLTELVLAQATYDAFTVVIVLNVRGRVVGAVVDSVSDVLELASASIKPAPEMSSAVDAGFITGIGTVKNGSGDDASERMLILMDIEALMASADMGLINELH